MADTVTPERTNEQESTRKEFPVLTPYALAKVATAIAKQKNLRDENGKPLQLKPQALYGMSDRGTLKVVRDSNDKQFVPSEEGARIVRDFLSGRIATRTQSRVDVTALANMFGGLANEAEAPEAETSEPEETPDLTDQLRASIEAAGGHVDDESKEDDTDDAEVS